MTRELVPPTRGPWCGTERGFQRHGAHGQSACRLCYLAHVTHLADKERAAGRRDALDAELAARRVRGGPR